MEGGMEAQASGGGTIVALIQLVIIILVIASVWKVFVKANLPGWGAIIPIYNAYLMLKVAARPGWWLLLLFIPIVNIVIALITMIDIAKNFGKGVGFGLGLFFLGFIFFPILGFGDAQYMAGGQGPDQGGSEGSEAPQGQAPSAE